MGRKLAGEASMPSSATVALSCGPAPVLPLGGRCALVMAHPDDEALWASSILAQMEHIVLVFGPVGSKPRWTEGRRRAMAAFPLPGAEHLDLTESEVFGGADWEHPVETPQGIAVRRGPGTMAGFSAERYRMNHARLLELLAPRLEGMQAVVTHAPWGEYGHEEHVQVFRAVEAVARRLGVQVWVPGYVSDVSMPLMRRHLGALGAPTPFLPTDPELGDRLRRLYQENGCWTWLEDYLWPECELFYPWTGGSGPPPKGRVHPINHIWRGPRPPHPSLPARILGRARRAVRRIRGGSGSGCG
jgi:LmbE family N-acetylglucosaminyl deacetylase